MSVGASSAVHCCSHFLMSSAFFMLHAASRRPGEMRALHRQVGQHTAVTAAAQLDALINTNTKTQRHVSDRKKERKKGKETRS